MSSLIDALKQKLAERLNWETFKNEISQGFETMPQAGVVLPESILVKRLLEADKGAEISIKTLQNFIKNKASGSPYWKNIDLVNPRDLRDFQVVNRYYHPKHSTHIKDVEDYLIKNGIDDAGILFVDPKTHQAMLNEGNTRLSIALRNEVPFYPVRGYRWGAVKPGFPMVSKHPLPNQFGYTPADLFMNELGFETYNTSDLVKNEIIRKLMNLY